MSKDKSAICKWCHLRIEAPSEPTIQRHGLVIIANKAHWLSRKTTAEVETVNHA